MKAFSIPARIYVVATIAAGACLLALSLPEWRSEQLVRFGIYLALALLASNLKVALPGITGTMSANFVFVLIGVLNLNLPQVLAIGFAGALGQYYFRAKTRRTVRLAFNLSSIGIAAFASFHVFHARWVRSIDDSLPLLLVAASATLFVVNTASVSGVIALTERKSIWQVWREHFWWTASHYLVGAGLATAFQLTERYLGWETVLLTIPVIYLVYRSYSLHLGRLESATAHAREMNELHWRTIEALGLAVDAKDETTHNHLLRVKVYATEICRELKLDEKEVQAVQAAALLHDIGKLAVPEHIISKPGKLTPEEFDKMKVHPVVGAEILERVRFPYPVVPIVRSHHEKWNGKGYPEGLKGEEIPIGARILAAVDCLDALATDRQYRRALPLDEAMKIVSKESGESFDPKIVAILERRYVELEKMALATPVEEGPKLSKNVKVERGGGPAAGYAESGESAAQQVRMTSAPIAPASAEREFQRLANMTADLGSALTPDETLALFAARIQRMVPHDSITIFERQGSRLVPAYSGGLECAWFLSQEFRMGEGLTGWVVENGRPITNGNPAVEPGYGGALKSALSIPLTAGAITLYSANPGAFTAAHAALLSAIAPHAAAILKPAARIATLTTPAPAIPVMVM